MDRNERFESLLTDSETKELRHISVEIVKFMSDLIEKAKESETDDGTRKASE